MHFAVGSINQEQGMSWATRNLNEVGGHSPAGTLRTETAHKRNSVGDIAKQTKARVLQLAT